jgi:hypothetical protein
MFKRNLLCAAFAVALTMGLAATPSQAQPNVRQATFGNLISALNNINVQIGNLEVLTDLIDIGVIKIGDINIEVITVGDVLSGNNVRALNNALNRNDVEINVLRNFLNDNVVLQDFLNESLNDLDINVLINDVIAVNVLSGGDLIFFVP